MNLPEDPTEQRKFLDNLVLKSQITLRELTSPIRLFNDTLDESDSAYQARHMYGREKYEPPRTRFVSTNNAGKFDRISYETYE